MEVGVDGVDVKMEKFDLLMLCKLVIARDTEGGAKKS